MLIRRLLLLCWAVVLAAQAAAQPQPNDAVMSKYLPVVDGPVAYGTCYVTAVVNGQRCKLLVDTGFGMELILTEQAAETMQLKLEPSELERVAGFAQVKLESSDARGPDMQFTAAVYQFPGQAPFEGIVGWKLLRHAVWVFDYPGKRHAFHDKLPEDVRNKWESFPIDLQHVGGNLAITVPVDGEDKKVIIDTGASVGLALSANLWRKWLTARQPEWLTVEAGISPGTAGLIHVTPVGVDPNARIGDFELGEVVVTKSFFEVNLGGNRVDLPYVIGTQAFRHRRVVFDGPGNRVYFGPLGKANDELPALNRAQAVFSPTEVDSGLMMAYVLEGGVAYRAGLRDGDRLLEIDGVNKRVWFNEPFSKGGPNSFEREPGRRVKVLVLRGEEEVEIEVTLGRSPLDPDAEDEQP